MYKIINKKKRIATAVADVAGYLLLGLPYLLKRNRPIRNDQIQSILVMRTAYIGDVVMTLPILKPLREQFPTAKISFLTASGATPVLENNPYLDEVITYDPFWFYPTSKEQYRQFIATMRGRQFDLVIDARADIRELLLLAWRLNAKYRLSYDVGGGGYLLTHTVPYPGLKHKVEYHLDLVRFLGYRGTEIEWGVYLADDEKRRIDEIITQHGLTDRFIAIHPGSRVGLKRWSAERYASLADMLAERFGLPIVIFGTPAEQEIVDTVIRNMRARPVSLAGTLSLREVAGVIGRATLFICNDSGPMHIAAAMKTPTVAIFGPSKSIETGPFGDIHHVVEKDFSCRPTCDEGTCTHARYNACIEDISVDDVLIAAVDSLARNGVNHV